MCGILCGVRLIGASNRARISPAGSEGTLYVINDHLGTPMAMVDSAKTIRWKAKWNPFGQLYSEFVSATNDVRFPGQLRDDESGLYYNWHRYYGPKIGRYYQVDPIGLGGGINLYGYVHGFPTGASDRNGLDPRVEPSTPFGSSSEADESDDAVDYWASQYNKEAGTWYSNPRKGIAALMGGLAVLKDFSPELGEEAVDYWGCKYGRESGDWYSNPSKLGYGVAGSFAALWTKDNSWKTGLLLGGAYGARNAFSFWAMRDGSQAWTLVDFGQLFRYEYHNLGRGALKAPAWHIDALWGLIRHLKVPLPYKPF